MTPADLAQSPTWLDARICKAPVTAHIMPAQPAQLPASAIDGQPWATAALEGETHAVATFSEKDITPTIRGRNDRLLNAAIKLGGIVAGGYLQESVVRSELTAAADMASANGSHVLTETEINNAIDNGLKIGMATPRHPNLLIRDATTIDPSSSSGFKPLGASSGPCDVIQRHIRLVSADDISDDIPTWAWEHNGKGRVQLGTLGLLGGRPGAGKSSAARYFAAKYTRGEIPGCWYGLPRNVGYIAPAEESLKYIVKPGLRAADADMSRISFPKVESDDREVTLLSMVDEEPLTAALIAAGITVVFVDPVMSTIGGKVDIHRNNEVRQYIEPWARRACPESRGIWVTIHDEL